MKEQSVWVSCQFINVVEKGRCYGIKDSELLEESGHHLTVKSFYAFSVYKKMVVDSKLLLIADEMTFISW